MSISLVHRPAAQSPHYPESTRDRMRSTATLVLGRVLLLPAFLRSPRRSRYLACQWALGLRFPRTSLTGVTSEARRQFTQAQTNAFWRDGQLIGLTSGHRDHAEQEAYFAQKVVETGSAAHARRYVLPAAESAHVAGTAFDVRPRAGAAWLEEHGAAHDLYRTYDNEWWHFEYRPEQQGRALPRLPHPGFSPEPGPGGS